MEKRKKEILIVAQYPEKISPNQRFRFELYKDILTENGYTVTTSSFLNKSDYEIIHKQGYFFKKFLAVIKGYFKRTVLLFKLKKYNYVFLQREATPLGPAIFEWMYIKVCGKKLIYDFDDAIWLAHVSEHNTLSYKLKNPGKVKAICKWAYKISCGNDYLCRYAKQFNSNVVYNPTCVDTEKWHNVMSNHNVPKVTVGWTGTFSTLKYFEMVLPVLKKLQEKYDFNIKIICNQAPLFEIKNLTYVEWTEQNEVTELASCQIGLMPLTSDEWSEGKCGFKLVQYLALGIPAVSSPVGVNKKIVDDGINGILCDTDEEWYNAIEKMINEKELRKKMGEAGRKKIVKEFSLLSNKENFLRLFS